MPSRPTLTRQEKRAIIDINPFCVYCGDNDYEGLVLEHIYPYSLGGSSDLFNITISCGRCNSHKYNYPIPDFLSILLKKRDYLLNKIYTYCYNLRQLRNGRPRHYLHSEKSLRAKITDTRERHSYFTRIIHSIINNKYQIFNNGETV